MLLYTQIVKLSSVKKVINILYYGLSMLLAEFFKDDFHTSLNEMAEELSDVVTARELIGQAMREPMKYKHEYFEFLKHLRSKHGSDYSTRIHQKAAKLARVKEQD